MNIIDDILSAVKEVTGITIDDQHKNLLHKDFGIVISDFLYILDILDKKGYPIYETIEANNYSIFTVDKLAALMADK